MYLLSLLFVWGQLCVLQVGCESSLCLTIFESSLAPSCADSISSQLSQLEMPLRGKRVLFPFSLPLPSSWDTCSESNLDHSFSALPLPFFCSICLRHFFLGRKGPYFSKRAVITEQLLAFVSKKFCNLFLLDMTVFFPKRSCSCLSSLSPVPCLHRDSVTRSSHLIVCLEHQQFPAPPDKSTVIWKAASWLICPVHPCPKGSQNEGC